MVNRINRNLAHKADKLTESNGAAVRGYKPQQLSSQSTKPKTVPPIDDVIAHLVNAHENRRARQVSEWERMRGMSAYV